MNRNRIYLRLGRPRRFKVESTPSPIRDSVIKFILKWGIILIIIVFFIDDLFRFLLKLY